MRSVIEGACMRVDAGRVDAQELSTISETEAKPSFDLFWSD